MEKSIFKYGEYLIIQYERFSSFTTCDSLLQLNMVSSSSITRPSLWLKNRFSESLVHHGFHRGHHHCVPVPPGRAEGFLPVPERTVTAQGEQCHEQIDVCGLISG